MILTYKRGSRAGAVVLNQRLILLNVPKDVALKNFKIIYEQSATTKKKPLEENDAKVALGAHNNNAFTA